MQAARAIIRWRGSRLIRCDLGDAQGEWLRAGLVGWQKRSNCCTAMPARDPGLQGVKGGHAEQVAAATGSPQKADALAAGRDFGLGPGH